MISRSCANSTVARQSASKPLAALKRHECHRGICDGCKIGISPAARLIANPAAKSSRLCCVKKLPSSCARRDKGLFKTTANALIALFKPARPSSTANSRSGQACAPLEFGGKPVKARNAHRTTRERASTGASTISSGGQQTAILNKEPNRPARTQRAMPVLSSCGQKVCRHASVAAHQ